MNEYANQILTVGLLWGWGGVFIVLTFILYEIHKRLTSVEEELAELKRRGK